MPENTYPPNISTPISWKYGYSRWNMQSSALSTESTRLNRLLPCRIFASALSYPPKVSTAPKISTCTIANPEITYVLINRVLRYCLCYHVLHSLWARPNQPFKQPYKWKPIFLWTAQVESQFQLHKKKKFKGKLHSTIIISDLVGFFFCRVWWWRSEVKIRTGTRSNRRPKVARKSWVTSGHCVSGARRQELKAAECLKFDQKEYRKVAACVHSFNFLVRLLFKRGLYAMFWVWQTGESSLARCDMYSENKTYDFVNVTNLFQNVNKQFFHAKKKTIEHSLHGR